MRSVIDMEPGYFYQVDKYHIITTVPVSGKASLHLEPWSNCFFSVYAVLVNFVRVGLAFSSPYPIENHGGYIYTHVKQKAGKATTYDVVVRTKNIVIYHFHNCGALAISPRVNPSVMEIIKEQ